MSVTEETTTETTKIIEIGDSKESLILATEDRGISHSVLIVCCHNVMIAICPFLAHSVTYTVLSFVDALGLNVSVSFLAWTVLPLLNLASSFGFSAENVARSLSLSSANLVANNQSPNLLASASYTPTTPPPESYYVDLLTGSLTWNTHAGATPWLDNVTGHYIGAYTQNVSEEIYTFAHISSWTGVSSVKLVIECLENFDIAGAELYLDYGLGWVSKLLAGFEGDGVYHSYTSAELIGVIDTLAKFNATKMKIVKRGASAYSVSCRKCKLLVVR